MAIPLRVDLTRWRYAPRRGGRKMRGRPAAIYDGATRTEAVRIGGVTPQIVRDWVLKFNAAGLDGLVDRKAPGPPPRLDDTHRAALAATLGSGPIPAVHGVVRWRLVDLCQLLWDKQTLSRKLRAMGYRKLPARPRHHEQAEGAVALSKSPSPPRSLKQVNGDTTVRPSGPKNKL